MTITAEITPKDQFLDIARRCYAHYLGYLLPAGIVLMNYSSGSLDNLKEGAPISYILYYLMIWVGFSAFMVFGYMMAAIFTTNKLGRGVYTFDIGPTSVIEKSPTGTTEISYKEIKQVKSVQEDGIELQLQNGRVRGLFMRRNDKSDIHDFAEEIARRLV